MHSVCVCQQHQISRHPISQKYYEKNKILLFQTILSEIVITLAGAVILTAHFTGLRAEQSARYNAAAVPPHARKNACTCTLRMRVDVHAVLT